MTFITENQLNLLYNIYRCSHVRLKTMSNLILSFLKRWKTTSREEDLNRRWILITGNQINFLYKIYRCSHVGLKTIFNLFCLLLKRWKTTSREDDLNRIQLLITRTQLNLLCNSLIELKQFSTFQMQIFFSSCLSMVAQLSLSLAQLSPSLFSFTLSMYLV